MIWWTGENMAKRQKKVLDVFERHQLAVARKTLNMPDAILGVLGGMTKEEALEIVRRLG